MVPSTSTADNCPRLEFGRRVRSRRFLGVLLDVLGSLVVGTSLENTRGAVVWRERTSAAQTVWQSAEEAKVEGTAAAVATFRYFLARWRLSKGQVVWRQTPEGIEGGKPIIPQRFGHEPYPSPPIQPIKVDLHRHPLSPILAIRGPPR